MEFLFAVIILVMSVVIHEVSHGYAALALDDSTAKYQGRLTLNPFTHIDPIGSVIVPLIGYLTGGFIIGWARPVPFNPYNLRPEKWGIPARFGEAIVAAAGPLSNIVIALIFGMIIRFAGPTAMLSDAFISITSYVVFINLTLAVFNLIPVPPLDGSKILFSFLPYRFQGFKEAIEGFGIIIVFLFVFYAWSLIGPIIGTAFEAITGLAF
jgi:Zn-dependent protease